MKTPVLTEILKGNARPLVMGILNVTPDSFYDGGRYVTRHEAVGRAVEMAENGADIIDIGGESSRPGAQPVSEEEELSRVIPVLEGIRSKVSLPISIDTYKAGVAARALKSGASIVNDISALRFDEAMVGVVRDSGAWVVLMHMFGTPRTMQKEPHYDNVVGDIIIFLRERIECAVQGGIPHDRIIVDPGIGFGKTLEHNLEILRRIERFTDLGCPVMVGASRKSMIEKITGSSPDERIWGTAAITAHCVLKGIAIHRVHDVAAIRQVCDVAAAIRGNSWE